MKKVKLHVRVSLPDCSDILCTKRMGKSIYGDIKQSLPYHTPITLGNYILITHYVNSNLCCDILTGRAVTGMLDFPNTTPIDWFLKKSYF